MSDYFMTPWALAPQTSLSMGSLSMGFPRQERWSGLPFPPPGDLPNPGSNQSLLLGSGCLITEPTEGMYILLFSITFITSYLKLNI